MLNDDDDEITVQKRHLVMSVNKAYSIWKSENTDLLPGKSKFASLHLNNVLTTRA